MNIEKLCREYFEPCPCRKPRGKGAPCLQCKEMAPARERLALLIQQTLRKTAPDTKDVRQIAWGLQLGSDRVSRRIAHCVLLARMARDATPLHARFSIVAELIR